MPAELTIKFNDKRVKRMFNRFKQAQPGQRKRGMFNAGRRFLEGMKTKMSGEGFTRNPGRASAYPGTYKGRTVQSMRVVVNNDGTEMRAGPWTKYAPYLEFFENRNTKISRPFVRDTLEDHFDDAMDDIRKAIFSALRST